DEEAGKPLPPTAQAAIQHADTCVNYIVALIKGGLMEQFQFVDTGTAASLGVTDGSGTVIDGTELRGKLAAAKKTDVDNRSLFLLGGMKIILKKGKVRPF